MADRSSGNPRKGPRGFVASDGEQIYYETYGDGDPVVFTHGLGGSHAIWYQQVPEFARYFRVVTWDQRGFGRSSNKANKAGPDSSVADLIKILDALSIDQAHLIGQSMGGWTTLGLALAHPERVNKIVLGDTTAGIFTDGIERAFDEYARKAASLAVPTAPEIGAHPALAQRFRQKNLAQAFLYEQIGEMSGDPPATIWSACRKTAYPHEKVRRLEIPSLFIAGSDDPIFSQSIIEEAASILSGSRTITVPDAGHSPYFEIPRLWNESVLEFLREVRLR
jgi:3-oxoadipate enol-lactonase